MAAKEHKERIDKVVGGDVRDVSGFTWQVKHPPSGCVGGAAFFVFFAFSRGCFNCGV